MNKISLASIDSPIKPTWCPGCGNYAILASLRQALVQLEISQENLVIFYGIGCSGNMADFNKIYGFHSLHGRAIANAIGAKLANHQLKVIVVGGDGDLYGEGLSHLIAGARGNHDITVLVHNNQRYSLTTGQSSPTTEQGTKTKSTPTGLIEQPLNPLAISLDAGASFVARAYVGQSVQLTKLIKDGITHEGFALIDILQPCPTFNKKNTYQWFNKNVYDLGKEKYSVSNKKLAWEKANQTDKLPIGLFYQNKKSIAYHKQIAVIKSKTLLAQATEKRNLSKVFSKIS